MIEALTQVRLTILVGAYAMRWHLGVRTGVTETVADWSDRAPEAFALPHPSWRNTAWLKRNPFFEADVVPALRHAVGKALADD